MINAAHHEARACLAAARTELRARDKDYAEVRHCAELGRLQPEAIAVRRRRWMPPRQRGRPLARRSR